VPRQLPAPIRDFTGRAADLLALDALLPTDTAGTVTARSGMVVISAIDGAAGIGKTTLAVYWAHRMRHRFPDGTLYANLRGYGPGQPATPSEVLDAFLRALGTPPGRIPAEVEERAALYRSLLDDRRVLIVLDNAGTPQQVRPLMPAGAGCLALVTSRSSMTGLVVGQGAARISLDLLSFDEALVLLRGIVGDARADGEPQALAGIVHACARLPLALRIAGARAASRPRVRLADLRAELLDQHTRLDALSATGDETTAVRAVFAWSYHALPAGQALMFRRLGLHPGVQIDVYAAAALADTSPDQTRINLEALADVHLAESAGPERYLAHDLLRAYAAEQAEYQDTETEWHEATLRLLGYYLHTADTVDRVVYTHRRRFTPDAAPVPRHAPDITTRDQAMAWFDAERTNLVAVARHAADNGQHATAWQLAAALIGLFDMRGHRDEKDDLTNTGLASARILRDLKAEHYLLIFFTQLLIDSRRILEAEEQIRRALDLARVLEAPEIEAYTRECLARVCISAGDFTRAVGCARQALEFYSRLGDTWYAAFATISLGRALLGLHQPDDAAACFRKALETFRAVGDDIRESVALHLLGNAHRAQGQLSQAVEQHRLALNTARDVQYTLGEAEALRELGDDARLSGDTDTAREHWAQALTFYERLGDPRADDMHARLHK
jgi:tetratricopeptide (TPR) repeat protein